MVWYCLMNVISLRVLVIISTAAALTVSSGNNSRTRISPARAVQVWDDVLGDVHRETVHAYASKSGLGHRCFSRPLAETNENIIERTLDAILTEIENSSDGNKDSKQYVEYWTRQEYRHIEAHADVDENLSKRMDQGELNYDEDDLQSKYPATYQNGHRYPVFGHVLYLQVGTDVRGPTCIFPSRSSGGDLFHDLKLEGGCSEDEDHAENHDKEVQLTAVPAKGGRLLRFNGRDLHSVPRPTDIWMLPFVKGSPEYEPEDVWGRSVILFNVWPGTEDPPLDVPLNRKETGALVASSQTLDATSCNSFANWNAAHVAQEESSSSTSDSKETNQSVKVWLLGNERRRDYPMRTVPLLSPTEGGRDAVREALAHESQVTELWLRQK